MLGLLRSSTETAFTHLLSTINMYTKEEYQTFFTLVAKWAGGWSEWRQDRPYPITLVEFNHCNFGTEYRVYVEGVGLPPGYSHMFSYVATQEDINMYLFQEINK